MMGENTYNNNQEISLKIGNVTPYKKTSQFQNIEKLGEKEIYIPDKISKGSDNMDNNEILKIYLNKIDQDQRDLKKDILESENRTEKRMSDMEQRIENRVLESQKRTDEQISQIASMIEIHDIRFSELENKIDSLSSNVISKSDETKKFLYSSTLAVVTMVAATVVGIAGIAIAVWLGI